MPIPIVAATIAAGRKAALSSARRTAQTKRGASKGARRVIDPRDNISWIEVLGVAGLTLFINDIPDLSEVVIITKLATVPIDVITMIALALWFWLRAGESFTKSGVKNGVAFFVELIPVIGIIPLWTIAALNVKLKWFDWLFNLPAKFLK